MVKLCSKGIDWRVGAPGAARSAIIAIFHSRVVHALGAESEATWCNRESAAAGQQFQTPEQPHPPTHSQTRSVGG